MLISKQKPLIGVIGKNFEGCDKDCTYASPSVFIGSRINEAIKANGGIAAGILPPDEGVHQREDTGMRRDPNYRISPEAIKYAKETLSRFDGVVGQGGHAADIYEEMFVQLCYAYDIPMLNICEAHQTSSRVFGGSTKHVDNPEKHFQPEKDTVHKASVLRKHDGARTLFHRIVGSDEIEVNSKHTWCVDKVPEEFICSARDDDGNVEVMEAPKKKFFLTTQFHPEYPKSPQNQRIWESFISAAQSR